MSGRKICNKCSAKFGWTVSWSEDKSSSCADCAKQYRSKTLSQNLLQLQKTKNAAAIQKKRAIEKAANEKAIEEAEKKRAIVKAANQTVIEEAEKKRAIEKAANQKVIEETKKQIAIDAVAIAKQRAIEKAANQKAIEEAKKQRIKDEAAIAKKKAIDNAEHARQLEIRQMENQKLREKRQEELDKRRIDTAAQTKKYEAAEITKQMNISSESDNTKAEYVFKEAQERTKQIKAEAEEKRKGIEATEYTKQLQAKKDILAQYASMIETIGNTGIDKKVAASLMTRLVDKVLENEDRVNDPNTPPKTKPKPKHSAMLNQRPVPTTA